MLPRRSISLVALLPFAPLALAACSTPANAPSDGSSAPVATLAPPAGSGAPQASAAAASAAPSATAAATDAPSASAAASAEPAPSATATASAAATGAASAAPNNGPIPSVKVANIGMHIGGGPNDAPTKAPIKQSVEPHFDELKRCFALVEDQKKGGDFGLDLLIDKAGGKAKVSHPRTTMKGNGFKECMVAAFEAIDFKKPRGGTTTVSYSVRFTP